MSKNKALNSEEIQTNMQGLTDWTLENDKKLTKAYKFKNFKEALAFTNKVGEIAEAEKHHPDIQLSYGKVVINQETHEGDGLTEKDFTLAQKIDQIEMP
ncbi:4a-hydroxytetrahydrobiopterin dehydratase [Fundicoccus culcitae]|uniref:Putative pterin-4-alpha-carbinolamine dehydratase n=1 Tax=Fundicoccus culcitae TaxID=2969821 RepID=A0ABY5P7T9_9LACT|nr:4a-hydroxytetrahydrobiopterin dehydratase [Fundicoccus culcitae]UUX34802.1 4a-hydroxytetrahydrobiopterin dehydratase [Fundicoccus culcitae]